MRSGYRQIAFVKFFRRGFVGERFSANFAFVMRFSSVCGTCRFDFRNRFKFMRSGYRQITFVKFFHRGFVGKRFSAHFAFVMRFSSVCGTSRFDFFVSDERMFMLFGLRIAKRSVRLYSSDVIAESGITRRRTRIRKVFAVFITEPDFCIARNHLDDNRKPLAFF